MPPLPVSTDRACRPQRRGMLRPAGQAHVQRTRQLGASRVIG